MECCICLSNITDKQVQYKLSCDHVIHFKCFKDYIYKTTGHIFIKCPLCREMNVNNSKPFTDPLSNIKILCQNNLSKKRCKHILKNGIRCKKSANILNYGCCELHSPSKEILSKDKYNLMCDYLYYLLLTSNDWRTKINMIDMSKKIICQWPTKINKIDDIHYYFTRFFNYNLNNKQNNDYYVNPLNFYKYYNLESPPSEWVQKCVEERCII